MTTMATTRHMKALVDELKRKGPAADRRIPLRGRYRRLASPYDAGVKIARESVEAFKKDLAKIK